MYSEKDFQRGLRPGSSASSAFHPLIPKSTQSHSNSKNASKNDSSINPARVFHTLSRSSSSPKLKTTEYDPKFTKCDDIQSFQLPPGILDEGRRLVFLGRYAVEEVLSTDGVTGVVLKGRDRFQGCAGGCGVGGGGGVGSNGGDVRDSDICLKLTCGCRCVAIKVLHAAYVDVGRHEGRMLRSLSASDRNALSGVCRLLDDFFFGPHFCLVLEFVPTAFPSMNFRRERSSIVADASQTQDFSTSSDASPMITKNSSLSSGASASQTKDFSQRLFDEIRIVAFKLVVSLGFFRWTNVIHGDLKPENILISTKMAPRRRCGGVGDESIDARDDGGDRDGSVDGGDDSSEMKRNDSFIMNLSPIDAVKIIDFGNAFSDTFEETSSFYDDFQLQSPLYRAPEIFFGVAGFDAGIDVWSLGAILAEFFLGKPLFAGETPQEILGAIVSLLGPLPRDYFRKGRYYGELSRFTEGKPEKRGDVVERLCNVMGTRDRTFVEFLTLCLTLNPSKRPAPSQLASHPFLAPVCPIAYLSEPKFEGKSRKSEVPYQNADLLTDYDFKPMKRTEALGADPTFVRGLDDEKVRLLSDGKVLVGGSGKDDANESVGIVAESLRDSHSEESSSSASFIATSTPLTSKNALCKSSSSSPVTDKENEEGQNLNLTASEMLLQLEREERRLADAEKLQESLKRKAVNLELQRNSPNKAMTSRQ